jgi:hypothetical protein
MADEKGPGLHIGDFVLGLAPARHTDGHLDDPEGRERERQQEADERVAEHSGDPSTKVPPPEASPAEAQAAADLDASIAAARAAQAPASVGAPVPILLRDPLTGKVIGSV